VELRPITASDLRRKIDADSEFVLVDALAPMVYAHSHLPGAINIPPSSIDPLTIGRRIPNPATEIVVYCSSAECEDSHETAGRLVELGYTNVHHYAGGKNEWRELGYPLERAGAPYVP